jgi:hypothetical protein
MNNLSKYHQIGKDQNGNLKQQPVGRQTTGKQTKTDEHQLKLSKLLLLQMP